MAEEAGQLESRPGARFKENHSLDSDDEEENEAVEKKNQIQRLAEENVEGEEEGDAEIRDDIKITPFNMKEEMEEGCCDADGIYLIGRKEKEIRDEWMDNIDWYQVKKAEEKVKDREEKSKEAETNDPIANLTQHELLSEMVGLMQPKETVARALSRLGGTGQRPSRKRQHASSATERWLAKKRKTSEPNGADPSAGDSDADRAKFERLTALADRLCMEGDMEVYSTTYESLSFRRSQFAECKEASIDMFADVAPSTSQSSLEASVSDEITWEYKANETAPVQGPFTTDQMLTKSDNGQLPAGTLCRKVGSIPFYSAHRIDFDLYLS